MRPAFNSRCAPGNGVAANSRANVFENVLPVQMTVFSIDDDPVEPKETAISEMLADSKVVQRPYRLVSRKFLA
jgi:hypothetical protein